MENNAYLASKLLTVGIGDDYLDPIIVEREKDRLIRYFRLKLERGTVSPAIKDMDDIINSATNIIRKAIEGYSRAPIRSTPEQTFMTRIKFLSKYDSLPEVWNDDVTAPKKKAKKVKLQIDKYSYDEIPDIKMDKLADMEIYLELLDPKDKEYFERRKKHYLEEFDFNNSSDQITLEALIADELLIMKLTQERMAGNPIDDEIMDTAQKRYRENIKILGLSRAQRLTDNSGQKGNISQLSETLDHKLEEIRNLADIEKREKIVKKLLADFSLVTVEDIQQLIEELEGIRQRALRPDIENLKPIPTINELPALAEIDAIVKGMSQKELN